jgi:hypothetical protein
MSESYSSLTLSQKAYVNSEFLKAASKWLLALVSCITFFSALVLAGLLFTVSQNIPIFVGVIISFILAVYIIVWFVIKAPHAYRRLSEWNEDYLQSAYILIFDTTLPKGESSGKRLLYLASLVFPELRPDIYYSALLDKPTTGVFAKSLWNKIRHRKDSEVMAAAFDQKIDSYNLDVVYRIAKGYFIIKNFENQVVTSDELKKFLEVISKQYTKIFRVIVVAKEYEPKLKGESLGEQIASWSGYNFPFDLIVEENLGYSVLWIGEK